MAAAPLLPMALIGLFRLTSPQNIHLFPSSQKRLGHVSLGFVLFTGRETDAKIPPCCY